MWTALAARSWWVGACGGNSPDGSRPLQRASRGPAVRCGGGFPAGRAFSRHSPAWGAWGRWRNPQPAWWPPAGGKRCAERSSGSRCLASRFASAGDWGWRRWRAAIGWAAERRSARGPLALMLQQEAARPDPLEQLGRAGRAGRSVQLSRAFRQRQPAPGAQCCSAGTRPAYGAGDGERDTSLAGSA